MLVRLLERREFADMINIPCTIIDKKSGKYVPHHTTGMETPARQPNAFAAFVKDNYKFHRTPGVSHTDAMKELSKEFAKNKI
jgi:hypothetical protein